MVDVTVTVEEQKAIASLERLEKKWPKTLTLFSWAGTLIVVKDNCDLATIAGIPNDGGDPEHINQEPEIDWEHNA